MLSNAAVLEISELSSKAEALARGGSSDRAQSSVLLAKIKTIRSQECSSDEMRARYTQSLTESLVDSSATGKVTEERYKRAFHGYMLTGEKAMNPSEHRDLVAGQQSITYTAGPPGGYLIPFEYEKALFTAMAQTDPLLSPSVCRFTMSDTPTLQPQQISGYDLSQIEAAQINESTQQTAANFPNVLGRVLRANITYKVSIGASIEAEQDVPGTMSKFAMAYGIALARKLGADAIAGNGTTQPQGILTALPTPAYTTTSSGIIIRQDLNAIYFSVNTVYRSSALCAWLMSDSVYQRVRNAVDAANRPLIEVVGDQETLLSKPIYISPSLGPVGGSLALNSTIVFGDLSHFHIRTSKPTLQRVINSSIADITQGKALYVARIRMDSALFDPSNGAAPPIVSATVQA